VIVNKENFLNDKDGRKKGIGEKLSQCQFGHHKSRVDWPGIENVLPR
jgi:hypothetical protein